MMSSALCRASLAACCFGICIATTAGCSLTFLRSPPPHPTSPEHLDCTTSLAAPIADASLAVLATVATVVAMNQAVNPSHAQCTTFAPCLEPVRSGVHTASWYVGAGIGAIAAVAYGSSSVAGFSRTSQCRSVRAQSEAIHRYPTSAMRGRALEKWKVAVALDPSSPWPSAEPVTAPSRPGDTPKACNYGSDCADGEACFDGFCRPR